jgi:hypothetical protein
MKTENENHNTRIRSTIPISESVVIATKMQVLDNFRLRVGNRELDGVNLCLMGKGSSNRPVQFSFLPEPYRQVWISTLHDWTVVVEEQQWDRMLICSSRKRFFFWMNTTIEFRWTLI